jgi:hypothetical protein
MVPVKINVPRVISTEDFICSRIRLSDQKTYSGFFYDSEGINVETLFDIISNISIECPLELEIKSNTSEFLFSITLTERYKTIKDFLIAAKNSSQNKFNELYKEYFEGV